MTFIKSVLWASKLNNKDKIEISDGVCPSWSTILKSLFLITLRNYWPSSGELLVLFPSGWTWASIISLPFVTSIDLLITSFPISGALVVIVVAWIDVDGIYVDAPFCWEGFFDTIFSFEAVIVGVSIFSVNFGEKTQPLRVMPPVPESFPQFQLY